MSDDRPLLVDLYGGGGGTGWGYALAGFRVLCVDLGHHPNNPLPAVQADAIAFVRSLTSRQLAKVAAFAASPPCPARSRATPMAARALHPELIDTTRQVLTETGKPYVIENVPGSPGAESLRPDLLVCGCMFDLRVGELILVRERHFETSWGAFDLRAPCHHAGTTVTVLRHGARIEVAKRRDTGGVHKPKHIPLAQARELMGLPWMSQSEIGNAIPPAYTQYVGGFLMEHLRELAAA